ncbi:MAG TPA: hypothetical protein VKD90_30310 [Gemmataceae bacterium]|nr:hypothetical protein [Gemmataceae bacterium]
MPNAEWKLKSVHRRGFFRVRVVLSFCLLTSAFCISAAGEGTLDPDNAEYLRRQNVWFRAQDPGRQQQLRKLHAEFQALDPDDRARLTRVMQTYNAWLAKLSDADRKRVLDAPNGAARLEVVRELREREWVESLPRPYKEEYAKAEGDARRQKVQEWRAEEAERREEWAVAQRTWGEFSPGKVPAVFAGEGRAQVDLYVANLKPNLSEPERKAIDDAKAAADEFGNYFWYAFEVARLSHLHPILPGRVGPKDFASLDDAVKDHLVKNDPQHFKRKGNQIVFLGDERKELRRSQGRWPEFALELADYCQKNKLTLPTPLGDCRKSDMPPEVAAAVEKLERELKRTDQGKAELKALDEAQGKWPEYPRMIIDLARKHKQSIPGWTLPGQQQMWDRLRAGKKVR